MHLRELQLLAEPVGGCKVLIRFTGKPGDDVGGHRDTWNVMADERHGASELVRRVTPPHRGEYAIGTALEGEVEVRAKAGVIP